MSVVFLLGMRDCRTLPDNNTQVDERTIFRHVCERTDFQEVGAKLTVAHVGVVAHL